MVAPILNCRGIAVHGGLQNAKIKSFKTNNMQTIICTLQRAAKIIANSLNPQDVLEIMARRRVPQVSAYAEVRRRDFYAQKEFFFTYEPVISFVFNGGVRKGAGKWTKKREK